jgi:hypothetical protein
VRALGILAVSALLAVPAAADVVQTKDGKSYEGKVLSQDDKEVVIETTFDGVKHLPRAEVQAVDTQTPPLRDQYHFRYDAAKDDAAKLWDLQRWATEKKLEPEAKEVLLRIVELTPDDKRARKMLGHEKVDGVWMTPEEKAKHLEEKHDAEMRAKGLVPYQGGWVTPEEKAAREKGMVKDGDDWVTEEEFHRRRGEEKKDGVWIKVGEAEGRAYLDEAARGAGTHLEYVWTPHFDVLHDGMAENAKKVADVSEAVFGVFRSVLKPKGDDFPETVDARTKVVLFKKQPGYAKFVRWFDQGAKASDLVPSWASSVSKQHAFWWAHPEHVVGVYQFPNPDKTLVSNAVHDVGLVLLTRYRLNYRFPTTWLSEGFAYYLEMETLKYSESFTVGRTTGATTAPGTEGQAPTWVDSTKWRTSLATLVAQGRDPPLKRMATMDASQMGYEELVKAWSVVELLVRTDPAKFKAFVDASKKQPASESEETALKAGTGEDYRALEQRWRAWVSGGYKQP